MSHSFNTTTLSLGILKCQYFNLPIEGKAYLDQGGPLTWQATQ